MKIKLFFIGLIFFTACTSTYCPLDDTELNLQNETIKYHQVYFSEKQVNTNKELSIYLDYSSGLRTAFQTPNNSDFYYLFINSLRISEPDFYSVDSDTIKKMAKLNKNELYKKIKDIKHYNKINAPLDLAIREIVNKGSESVFITDGELWKNEERDDPWAREEFGKWLKNGNLIEFYTTDFIEKGKQKHVFYIFFIPQNQIENKNNVANQFRFYLENSIEARNLNFSHFSFSNTGYKVIQDYPPHLKHGFNVDAEVDMENFVNMHNKNFEYAELYLPWPDMLEYIAHAYNENTGKPLKNGKALISNLYLDVKALEFYDIKELGIKVYDIKSDFLNYLNCNRCKMGKNLSMKQMKMEIKYWMKTICLF